MSANRKLSDEIRSEIRFLRKETGLSCSDLAAKYSVSPRTISRICNPEKYEQEKQHNEEYTHKNIQWIISRRKITQREFHLRLTYSKDRDMIEYLNNKDNISGYLKSLIRKDMAGGSAPDSVHDKTPD